VTVSLINARDGRLLAASTATRAATDLFALQDAVADDLLRALGRDAPPRQQVAHATLGPDDQRRFTEAVGLLQRVRDEPSADRADRRAESILRNARESSSVNALLARALLRKSTLARRPALIEQATVYAVRGCPGADDPEAHITLGRCRTRRAVMQTHSPFERALAAAEVQCVHRSRAYGGTRADASGARKH
jgi:hypothetical protein